MPPGLHRPAQSHPRGTRKIGELVSDGTVTAFGWAGLPQEFRGLEITWQGRCTVATNAVVQLLFELPATSNWQYQYYYAANGGWGIQEQINLGYLMVGWALQSTAAADGRCAGKVWIPEYLTSNFKVVTAQAAVLFDWTSSNLLSLGVAGFPNKTAPVQSVYLVLSTGAWASGSRAVLRAHF